MPKKEDYCFDFYLERPTNALLPDRANFNNYLKRPSKVGTYPANSLGLHDMHGNVSEWCEDEVKDQGGGLAYATRGGSFTHPADWCRTVFRVNCPPSARFGDLGLRVARVPVGAKAGSARENKPPANPASPPISATPESSDSNGPGTSPLPGNYALHFADTGERLEFPELKITAAGPWTVEAWVTPCAPQPNEFGNSSVVFIVSNAGLLVKHLGGQGIKWNAGGPATKSPPSISSGQNVEVNVRAHVALTSGPEGTSFYLNGVLQGQPLQLVVSERETTLRMCRIDPVWHKFPFHGEIDEIRVSSVVRYRESFTPKLRFEPDDDTLALYHFDEGQGELVNDSSRHAVHGKTVNAKWVRSN